MKTIDSSLVTVLLVMLCASTSAQTFSIVTDLSSRIEETSGLLLLNGRLITHNDSGGSVKLYEINTANGDVINDVTLNGATLTDWEDICADDEFIYVGDFGNNVGQRTNLKLYKVSIDDYLDGDQSANALELPFRYADQTNFDPAQFRTNFDAETLIDYEGNLLIFSKNWGDGKTRIYPIEKDVTSEQELNPIASIDVAGLVTGGVYDADRQMVVLTGYQNFIPFIVEIQVDGTMDFDGFTWERKSLQTQGGSTQVEGISLAPDSSYYLSGERTAVGEPTLYRYSTDTSTVASTQLGEKPNAITVFPNPAKDLVQIQGEGIDHIEIYDAAGKLVLLSNELQLQLAALARGTYTVQVVDQKGRKQTSILVLE